MPPVKLYTIDLLNPDGSLCARQVGEFIDDDAAVDHVGRSDHAYEIDVRREGVLVVRCPPWPPVFGQRHWQGAEAWRPGVKAA